MNLRIKESPQVRAFLSSLPPAGKRRLRATIVGRSDALSRVCVDSRRSLRTSAALVLDKLREANA
jgi:hypothetical protein